MTGPIIKKMLRVLPPEIIDHIVAFMDIREYLSFTATNKEMMAISQDRYMQPYPLSERFLKSERMLNMRRANLTKVQGTFFVTSNYSFDEIIIPVDGRVYFNTTKKIRRIIVSDTEKVGNEEAYVRLVEAVGIFMKTDELIVPAKFRWESVVSTSSKILSLYTIIISYLICLINVAVTICLAAALVQMWFIPYIIANVFLGVCVGGFVALFILMFIESTYRRVVKFVDDDGNIISAPPEVP